jgi:hypothetical protein
VPLEATRKVSFSCDGLRATCTRGGGHIR